MIGNNAWNVFVCIFEDFKHMKTLCKLKPGPWTLDLGPGSCVPGPGPGDLGPTE